MSGGLQCEGWFLALKTHPVSSMIDVSISPDAHVGEKVIGSYLSLEPNAAEHMASGIYYTVLIYTAFSGSATNRVLGGRAYFCLFGFLGVSLGVAH